MKRLLSFVFIIVLFFVLSGCNKLSDVKGMKIEEVKFTKNEESIASLIGSNMDYKLYDYKVNDKVKWITIKSYKLDKEGNWVDHGKSVMGNKYLDGRIAISKYKTNDQLYFSIETEDGRTTMTTNEESDENKEDLAGAYIWENSSEIILDKEIPLFMYGRMNPNTTEIEALDLTSFNETKKLKGYEAVFVVTVTFSEKEID